MAWSRLGLNRASSFWQNTDCCKEWGCLSGFKRPFTRSRPSRHKQNWLINEITVRLAISGLKAVHRNWPQISAAFKDWRDPEAAKQRAAAEQSERIKQQEDEARVRQENEQALEAKKAREFEKFNESEAARIKHRDADTQSSPYWYETDQHANEALAYRYGIANYSRISGSEYRPAKGIELQKVRWIERNAYECIIPRSNNRRAIVCVDKGSERISTFLPMDKTQWFNEFDHFEAVVKDSNLFSLKELVQLHLEKVEPSYRGRLQR